MILQDVGEKLAHAVKTGDSVVVELDFKESIAHPDDRYIVQFMWKGFAWPDHSILWLMTQCIAHVGFLAGQSL